MYSLEKYISLLLNNKLFYLNIIKIYYYKFINIGLMADKNTKEKN